MRFGLHYLTTYLPARDGSAADLYARVLAQVREAEALGFADVWVTEHHFHGFGGLIPHPPTFLAALAGATSHIRLGVAISLLALHHPLLTAEAYAMVDVLSGGRLELGVGRGASPEEFAEASVDYAGAARRMREHADVLRQAFADEPVNYHGEEYQFENVHVLPKPIQRPHPPIWVGASRSDDTFRWAGEQGFHLMTLPFTYDPPTLQHWIGVYRDALRAHGHDPARFAILGKFHAYVAEDDAAAQRAAAAWWLDYQSMAYDRASWNLSKPPEPAYFDAELAKRHLIVGDPARCVETLQYWQETLGLTAISLQMHYGGMPHEQALRSIRLFAERVMPAFTPAVV